jgi:hypothetical protein
MLRRRPSLGPWLLFALAACSPAATNGRLPEPTPTASTSGSAVVSEAPPKPAFENPGGMWLPEQLPMQADGLTRAGISLEAAALAKPTEFPLGAVVSLGGCSASFVSSDGLIVTNHHCVTGALQANSTKEQNLIKDGFLAKTRADERSAGPSQRVFVTRKMTDVTPSVRAGLAEMKDELARYQAIEDRTKKLVSDCEKDRPGTRCSVEKFFGGAEYRLVEQLEIRDVRLVYAPPEGVGNYGGEIDNWRWPRHTGDFSFLRAYVKKDGSPGDFSADNVPYKPAHVLKLATKPLAAGDGVMVAGYPARTSRLVTAAEMNAAIESDIPYIIDYCEKYLGVLEPLAAKDADLAIKAETYIRGLANALTNYRGQLEGLKKGAASKKNAEEQSLLSWIDADPARKTRFGGSVERTAKAFADSRTAIEADRTIREAMRLVRGFGTAYTILRNAQERTKPDDKREPDYQDRNQKRLEGSFAQLSKQWSPVLEKAALKLVIEREMAHPPEKRAGFAEAVLGKASLQKTVDPKTLEGALDALYDKTKLGDEKVRVKLLQTAKPAELARSTDPLVKLALKLESKVRSYEERDKRREGAFAVAAPDFVTAMREQRSGLLAPDANRTLRVTFGTVRGYAPMKDAAVYTPFTLLADVAKKHTGKDPFVAPPALLAAVRDKKFGPYLDAQLGDVPVNFLSDLDITGGNSGSATLNGRGELVGLAFDGNYESMAQAWVFLPEVTRTIHVDLRYMLWVMDAVSQADELLQELGVKPSL